MFNIENHVRTAVDRIGGPTKVASACSVSNATVHNWINVGRIADIDKARIIAAASKVDVQLLRSTR